MLFISTFEEVGWLFIASLDIAWYGVLYLYIENVLLNSIDEPTDIATCATALKLYTGTLVIVE